MEKLVVAFFPGHSIEHQGATVRFGPNKGLTEFQFLSKLFDIPKHFHPIRTDLIDIHFFDPPSRYKKDIPYSEVFESKFRFLEQLQSFYVATEQKAKILGFDIHLNSTEKEKTLASRTEILHKTEDPNITKLYEAFAWSYAALEFGMHTPWKVHHVQDRTLYFLDNLSEKLINVHTAILELTFINSILRQGWLSDIETYNKTRIALQRAGILTAGRFYLKNNL